MYVNVLVFRVYYIVQLYMYIVYLIPVFLHRPYTRASCFPWCGVRARLRCLRHPTTRTHVCQNTFSSGSSANSAPPRVDEHFYLKYIQQKNSYCTYNYFYRNKRMVLFLFYMLYITKKPLNVKCV